MNSSYSNIREESLPQDDRTDLAPDGQVPTFYERLENGTEDTDGNYYPIRGSNMISFSPDPSGSVAPDQIRGKPFPTPASPTISEMGRAKAMPDSLGRFRKAAKKTMTARRFSAYALRGQGVDATDMDSVLSCIETTVDVTVVDMNQSRCSKRQGMDNGEFLTWLQTPRPEWSKVRWININGMSWDVIKAIAIKYAVEDLLHIPQRTKVDIYPNQCYVACNLLTLAETLENGEMRQVDPLKNPHGIEPAIINQRLSLEKLDHYKYQYPLSESMDRLKVLMEQVTMFLLPDGTLITLFQVSGKSVVEPILERLSKDYSLSRKHNDASFLLQSVIDGIVDHAIPITDAYRQTLNELEVHVVALPKMKFTRQLHTMTAQLSLLKRTLTPTQALVHALRGNDERSPLSSLSRTYMGDVMDHCNTMVEDIDSMLALCEKLINMIFNLIAYDTNESMRRLALVSIIFLPITFIAGVYGTNFTNFPELSHSIAYFWLICAIVTVIVLLMFGAEYLNTQHKAHKKEMELKHRDGDSAFDNRRLSDRGWNRYKCW
ncbi:hypothetical protein EMPS_06725 [Entomortierella parvispora]|uniref:Magnesium transporter n=1 Tax=Entomortierella parvispora TaxID=205924 RepID=A0A9P3HD05_9FUNG|nr:hypothetical protein EMPS_06725 [Entomortierella parvispora]